MKSKYKGNVYTYTLPPGLNFHNAQITDAQKHRI